MTPAPTVAIISTVVNERDGLRELLDGFLSQSRAPDEIVVVDGGSTDGTLDVLHEYQRKYPSVRVFVQPGANIARGRNIAIHHARADIIAVTDGGCRPEREWLERLVQPLIDDPSFGAVTGARRIAPANPFELYAGLLSTSGNAADESQRVFHGRNSAFRKSVWQAVGGYPEWLYTAEDTLFAQRAKALGCRVALAEGAVVAWRPRPTWRKLGKQYYLYGRGTGRIGMSDLGTVRYHLRNHAAWMAALALSPLSPWMLLGVLGVWAYLYRVMLAPVIRTMQKTHPGAMTAWYVGRIVMLRSFANNLGQLVGTREYRRGEGFRRNLELYGSGAWRRADV